MDDDWLFRTVPSEEAELLEEVVQYFEDTFPRVKPVLGDGLDKLFKQMFEGINLVVLKGGEFQSKFDEEYHGLSPERSIAYSTVHMQMSNALTHIKDNFTNSSELNGIILEVNSPEIYLKDLVMREQSSNLMKSIMYRNMYTALKVKEDTKKISDASEVIIGEARSNSYLAVGIAIMLGIVIPVVFGYAA